MEERNFLVLAQNRQFLPFYSDSQKKWAEPFYFIQAADTQFGMHASYKEKNRTHGWKEEIAWSKQMVADINAMYPKPKFLVVCGDLTDAFPDSDPEQHAQQVTDFKKVFAGLDIPLVCVCGNHDVGNTPTPSTIEGYRKNYGNDYFSFWCGGVFFIVLNSQYYEDASKCATLAVEQEDWLEEQLEIVRREKPQHAVVFQHIPWFINNPEEDKEYFNMEYSLRTEMLERFHSAGIRHIFCGHYHRNAGGFYKDLEEVITSAVGVQLGDFQHGFRLVRVLENRLVHQYYALGTAPTHVHLPSSKPLAPAAPAAGSTPLPAWSYTSAASAAAPSTRKTSLAL
ncbi:serine/threonine-protein phosphatase CPPED1-like [Macrobrachium rosenbergii]|uniref:serine/threonine-protein phosphatase CPPED1-like n=1 Tax=Macrobrachium rosenbergii TaxID=79674 RepID=UPI0034D50A49